MSLYASLPPLVRLYIRSVVAGLWLSGVFVAALLWGDVAGLRRLVLAAPEGVLAVVLLVVFNALVFSGAKFGIRVMAQAEKDQRPGGGRFTKDDGSPPESAIPVRIAAVDRQ